MGYQVMNKIEMEPSGLSETYFHTMMRLMGENRDIMELEADLGVCILGGGYKEMEQTYPKQLFNCGIQEANMVGVACGLSAVGKIPSVIPLHRSWLAVPMIRFLFLPAMQGPIFAWLDLILA